MIHIERWSNLVVTLALKFKEAINLDLSIHVRIRVRRCTELWLWTYCSHIWPINVWLYTLACKLQIRVY